MSAQIPLVRPPRSTGAVIYDQETGMELVVFDAAVMEQHGREGTITDHPVEDGSDVTDHVQLSPLSLSIVEIASATALSPLIEAQPDRDLLVWDELVRLWNEKRLLTVATHRADYENMIITNLNDADTDGGPQWIEQSIMLREIRVASSQDVELPPERYDERVRHSSPGNRDVGRQQGADAETEGEQAAEDRGKSVLAGIADSWF